MKKSVILNFLSKSPRIGIRLNNPQMFSRKLFMSCMCSNATARWVLKANIRKNQPFTLMHQLENNVFTSCTAMYCVKDDYLDTESNIEVSTKDAEVSDEESDIDEDSLQLRQFLFPNSQDPIILQLRDCASVQSVFDIMTENESGFNVDHACQALVVLWDLQKFYKKVNSSTEIDNFNTEPSYFQNLINDYNNKVTSHEDFQKIVSFLERSVTELSPDAVTCIFLYLSRMGISCNNPIMPKLQAHIESLLDIMGKNFPITALSRFTVALFGSSQLRFIFSIQKAVPIIYSKIEICTSEDDFRFLTVCLRNIRMLVDSQTLDSYKHKIQEMIKSGFLANVNASLILKIASFLNYPYWSEECSVISKQVLIFLKGNTSALSVREIHRVHKILQNQLEPAFLLKDLNKQVSHLLSDNEELSFNDSAHLVSFTASFCSLRNKKALESLMSDYLKVKLDPHRQNILYDIIHFLKPSNKELCYIFWSKSLEVMREYSEEQQGHKLLRNANKYLRFNNSLNSTFRHYEFENQVISWLFLQHENGSISSIPSQFSRMIAFLVAFHDNQEKVFFKKLEAMVSKLIDMSPQLSEIHCYYLSGGLFTASKVQYLKPDMIDIFLKLDSLLNSRLEHHVEVCESQNLAHLNMLMRCCVLRKGHQSTHTFNNLVSRYENVKEPINSRIVRDSVHLFMNSNCLVPCVVDVLVDYVIRNKELLLGETAELVLFLCYNFGYIPRQPNEFFDSTSEVIINDSTRLSGLTLLQSSLALCFFRKLPEQLVSFIFCIKFLEQLDQEIANCYSKGKYPAKIRHYLMQLNRAVCLDYPEYDIPWFHKKYCEELAALVPTQRSVFFNDVRNHLIEALGDKELVKMNSCSPYGYNVDFVVLLNEKHKPVLWKHRTDKNISQVAIELLKEESFSTNVKSLKGYYRMKKRHLEILGYKFVPILQTHWNSMFMSEPGMKYEFIVNNVLNASPEKVPVNIV